LPITMPLNSKSVIRSSTSNVRSKDSQVLSRVKFLSLMTSEVRASPSE